MPEKAGPFASIDSYLETMPTEARERLEQIRALIHECAPDAIETIKYGMPTFTLGGGNLFHFAGWKKHVSLYPSTPEMEEAIEGLDAYTNGKGTTAFPLNAPLPVDLIRQMIAFRVSDFRDSTNYK